MTTQQSTTNGEVPRQRGRRWMRFSLAALLSTAVTASAFAQNDDPDNLTVPDSLEDAAETTPADQSDPDAPRVRVSPDAQQDRVVGKLVSVEGNTLTIEDEVENRQRSFQVPSGVKITRNGDRVLLRQLQPNDVVRIERGVAPDSVAAIVVASPAPSTDRDPDQQLRSQRRKDTDREPSAQPSQDQDVVRAAGGRVWVVLMDGNSDMAESGLRPGDVIVVADRNMLQSEAALRGLSSGLFPLRANADGEVIISPNAAGVGVQGTGAALPAGVNIGVGPSGANVNPSGSGTPNTAIPPRSSVGDENFGPPIGRRQNPEDRNFGPPIGTGNNPTPGAGQQPQPGQQPQQGQQPQAAPPAP